MRFLETYTVELFGRLKETRRLGVYSRSHPHQSSLSLSLSLSAHQLLSARHSQAFIITYFTFILTPITTANLQRVHITSQNPHMMKRRVSSQLEDTVVQLAMLKACIKVLPMIEEYTRQLKLKAGTMLHNNRNN